MYTINFLFLLLSSQGPWCALDGQAPDSTHTPMSPMGAGPYLELGTGGEQAQPHQPLQPDREFSPTHRSSLWSYEFFQ